MTQAKYIEVKKIVNFLNCKSLTFNKDGLTYQTDYKKLIIPYNLFEIDWNWLILLVQKVQFYKEHRYKLYMFHDKVIIMDSRTQKRIIHINNGNLNEMVYKACIQFIDLKL